MPHAGPLAVANSLTKVGGAIFFCWLFGLVIPADAYHLWGWSDDPALSTWALWTAPCVGAAVLLVALRQVDGTQAVRPLPQAEERAMSVALVNRLGPTGSALVAGGAALAAGLVFRGAWLDLLTTTVFSPPDVSAVLDPVLDEATMMRCVAKHEMFLSCTWCFPGTRLARCCQPPRPFPYRRFYLAWAHAPAWRWWRRCIACLLRCSSTPRSKNGRHCLWLISALFVYCVVDVMVLAVI